MSAQDAAGLGAVYAEALAAAAEGKGLVEAAGAELAAFAAAWRADRPVRTFFLSGAISRDAKRRALERAAAGRASDVFADFLQVLLRRQRLWALPEVADAYARILDRRLKRVPVVLSTAVPVAPADLAAWTARLRAALGREPVVRHEVRPALIGGAVLRVGDVVADGSVRRRLADLRERFRHAGAARG